MKLEKSKTSIPVPKLKTSVDRKERLFDAAIILFSELGFHGVAVPKIAKEAGISTGSIYNYFESKEDLVNQLFWFWKNELKLYYLNGYPADASIKDQFEFIWARLHKYTHDHPQAFLFIEGHMHASYLNQDCLDLEEEVFEIGRMFIRAGQAKGVIRKADPQLLVGFFFGAFVQYFKDCRASRQKWTKANSFAVRDFCWTSLSIS
ncbi:MAG: TetR/AcrR family transcriptional regulator [Proteobacteria bacterium]|nr:MAG: TetR/AcrR family transcriptional regulator [Pseudomonadota bacterium]